MAVIAIAIYFFPGLEQHRSDAYRVQAQNALIDLSAALRNHKEQTGSFAGTAGNQADPANSGSPWIVPVEVPGGGAQTQYRLRIANASSTGFEIRAVPAGEQVGDACGTLTLTAGGNRGMLNAARGILRKDCWTLPE